MKKLYFIVPLVLILVGCGDDTTITNNLTAPSPVPVIIQTTSTQPVTTTPCSTTPNCTGTNPTNPTVPTRPLEIVLFSADQNPIIAGSGVILRWEVTDSSASVRIDPAPGNVGSTGSVQVFPTVTTTYTINARTASATVQRTLVVIVNPPV